MADATFRYYQALNDFLPRDQRQRSIEHHFEHRGSVKDMVESMGVPHVEIDLILVNQAAVDFSYIVKPGDRISVFPLFESLDISSLQPLRPKPMRQLRFVLDTHLAKLARYLRLLGFDALYSNNYGDEELAEISSRGHCRLLLTRDRGLLKRKQVSHGYWVRSTQPREQLRELVARLDLMNHSKPFSRCANCNGLVDAITRSAALGRVPAGIYRDYAAFCECRTCQKVYWQGSHYDRMIDFIDSLQHGIGQTSFAPGIANG